MAGAPESPAPVVLRPCAKLNLSLEVLGRRPDGYHEILSIFQAVDLRDTLQIWPDDDLTLECDRPDLSGEANLALSAARLLRSEAGITRGARLHLTKRIPVAAGLGGGSADAASALLGLSRLWQLDWPPERLTSLAARVGSDVPFFLGSPTALVSGRGERILPLPPLSRHWAIVVRPRAVAPTPPDKTRRLYSALTPSDYGDGRATHALADSLSEGEELDERLLRNSFGAAARTVFPGIADAEAAMLIAGAPWVRLTGSGPCLFSLLGAAGDERGERAGAIVDRLRADGLEAYLARTMGREDQP